ncbi:MULTISPECIES: helix-turn-helix domain-containing protein [unclassified Cobetia]|uniref:helix-turn-helix domain-containing protein n=1 Tax=unclassified Cobetia TaxID=2609414 RepID=UPI0020974844|nr:MULTISPECIES: helix-turn-helix domain-containing protein [unclassified Cobetia]MCO7230943.1 helix-turn-helix domain containing protein [Cobetia sp. Dlab-2-AX]MCO7234650.1 helix-turn-helix domain containing protein [Cobetia sp. Dlab-2-U]
MRNEYEKYSAAFKADIALLALEKHSIEEISSMYNVSYEFVYKCKSELLNNACTIFGGNSEKNKYTTEDVRELYDNIKKFIDGVDNFNYEIKQLRKDSSTPSAESATKNKPGYGPSNKLKKKCRPGSNQRISGKYE